MTNDAGKKYLDVVNIRLVREPSLYSEKPIRCAEDAINVIKKELAQLDREVFCVLNLKNNNQPINFNVVSMGTLNSSLVSPREVFKSSILSNAAGIICFHPHPSGNCQPSREDLEVTERLIQAGRLLDISVLDHIIVGGSKTYSLLENHRELWNSNNKKDCLDDMMKEAKAEIEVEEKQIDDMDYVK